MKRLARLLRGRLVRAADWVRHSPARLRQRNARRTLQLVDSVMLAERRQLAVVEFGGELLLLGSSAGGMRLLARTAAPGSRVASQARRSRAVEGKRRVP